MAEVTAPDEEKEDTHAADLLEGQDLDAINAGIEEDLLGGSEAFTEDTGEAGELAPTPADPDVPNEGGEPPHPATPPPSLVERLSEIGFQDLGNDEDAIDRLVDAYQASRNQSHELGRQLDSQQPLVNYGNQWLADRASQQAAPAAPAAAVEESPWWNPPKYDSTLAEKYRQLDPETGTYGWKDDTPPEVRVSADAYQLYHETWANDLTLRPDKVLPPIIEKIVQQELNKFRTESADERKQESEEGFWGDVQSKNPWLFMSDPLTNAPMIDPSTGFPALSEAGVRISQHMDRLEGIGDPRTVWDYAVKAYQSEVNQGVPAPTAGTATSTAPAPAETAATKKAKKQSEHLRRAAGHVPERSGSLPTPGQPGETSQNPHLRPGQKLMQQAAADGVEFW